MYTNQATKIEANLNKLRLQWIKEAKKVKSFRTIIPESEMSEKTFNDLLIAHGSIAMAKQGDLTSFQIDHANTNLIKNLYLYIIYNKNCEWNLDKGIMISGPYGTGKSVLMEAFAGILSGWAEGDPGRKLKAKIVKFHKVSDIFNVIVKHCGIPLYLINSALIIDEFGREPKQAYSFGNELFPVINLIEERYKKGIITFGTSNFNFQDLNSENLYGPMIGDRLKQMFNFIELLGNSRRK